MTAIVQVNVTQQNAAAPNQLQKTGAILSQGGTVTTAGASTLITQPSDLTAILVAPAAITSLAFATNVVTVTTAAAHNLPVHDVINLTIAGTTGTTVANGFNGTFACTITTTTAFTYALPGTTPGTGSGGTWVNASAGEIVTMANTFFSQGSSQSMYVLELGVSNPSEGVSFLNTWIAANPGVYYSYLVPREWDGNASYLAFLAQFTANTAKTYFFTTTTIANYALYAPTLKCVVLEVEAPSYGVWAVNNLTALAYSGAWAADVLTAITWAATNGGTVTATTTTAHTVQPGQSFTISGCVPTGYNGTFVALAGTTGTSLIYALAVNPGTETTLGTLVASVGGTATGTTTTAHGVLPGQTFTIQGSVAATIAGGFNGTFTALPGTTGSTLLYAVAANPGSASIDGQLKASYYTSAGIASSEFSLAAMFYVTLNYTPSTVNKVTPTAYSFLFGVTPFPTQGNQALLQTLENSSVNVVGTGAQGAISNNVLYDGTTRDGHDFTYWYSVDWAQINLAINIANAIINGSNNPQNPLLYNQNGINRLQQVAVSTMNSGITFGLVLGAVSQVQLDGPDFAAALDAGTFDDLTAVNAIPFVPYSQENPNDYAIGQYDGISVSYTPARGFRHIIFNLNVSDFVAT